VESFLSRTIQFIRTYLPLELRIADVNHPLRLAKVAVIAFLVGVSVAASIEVLGRCLDALNVHPDSFWSTVVIWVWPTALALIETSHDWRGYFVLVAAVAANGLLYSFLAFVLGYCINAVREIRVDE
jgi:hypothetical protein